MTANAIEAGNLAHSSMVGHVVVASVQRDNGTRSVWFYVIAALPNMQVFGVNIGTNSSFYAPLDDDGFRLETATVDTYTSTSGLDRLAGDVRDRLATFLRDAGVTLPTSQDGDAETRIREAVAAERARLQSQFEAWKEQVTEAAHEYANDNDLCGVFDQFMESQGLRPRNREYYVEGTVTVTYRVGHYIEGTSEEDALETLAENIREYVNDSDVTSYGDWEFEAD